MSCRLCSLVRWPWIARPVAAPVETDGRGLPFADSLRNACKHCATIARARMSTVFERGLVPRPEDDTATVTFIKLNGRTYAVTAGHVVDTFSRQAAAEHVSPEGYFLPAAPSVFLQPPLLRPPAQYSMHRPDIALAQVSNDLPGRIGKEALEVREMPLPTFPVTHALAVGFPTASKRTHAGARASSTPMHMGGG